MAQMAFILPFRLRLRVERDAHYILFVVECQRNIFDVGFEGDT